ncbi:MAG: hypothetical protein U5L09_16085 [Bacteroidales bacterium]|nr:hypothetical protein [Bacteroidales bacterium]
MKLKLTDVESAYRELAEKGRTYLPMPGCRKRSNAIMKSMPTNWNR